MKRIIIITTLILFSCINVNAQINNLSDLLNVSELSSFGLTKNMQGNWSIEQPYQKFFDNNKLVKEYMTFDYKGTRIQKIKRVTTMKISSGEKLYSTELISNEKELFSRIKNNLNNFGFEIKNQTKIMTVYSDGNILLKIQTKSYKETVLKEGYYSIQILMSNTKIETLEKSSIKADTMHEVKNNNPNVGKSTNDALNSILSNKKINLITNINDLITIGKTSSININSVLTKDWQKIEYPKGIDPVNEWYSFVNNSQYLESYVGWDNGSRENIRITTFEFSEKKLLDEFLKNIENSGFKLIEKENNYLSYENSDNTIVIYLNNTFEAKGIYKIEMNILPVKTDRN